MEIGEIITDPLKEKFEAKLREFKHNHPSEPLLGALVQYGAAVNTGENLTLWKIIKKQIEYRVEQLKLRGNPTTPEEFIDCLFSPNPEGKLSAEIIMDRLQLG